MINKPIYVPRGRAKEYGDYALNVRSSCTHLCSYCFCPAVLRKTQDEFFKNSGYREDILESTKKQLATGDFVGKEIFLCFIGDAYQYGHENRLTREIIKAIKESGSHVRILTKGGLIAERDFDILGRNDWFGVTYAGYNPDTLDTSMERAIEEPGAAPPHERLLTLSHAHALGINTWVSMEPVLDAEDVLELLERNVRYIDLYKIGKLNHKPSDIDWKRFGIEAERICKENGYDYYIKDDLRKEMEKQ